MKIKAMKAKMLAHLEEKHQALYLMFRIFKQRKNATALQKFFECETNPNFVRFEKNEQATIDDTVFLVKVAGGSAGFFAVMIQTLAGLYFCDYYQQKATVAHVGASAYQDESMTQTDNVFEYYFQQPSGYSVQALEQVRVIGHVTAANFNLARKLGDAQYRRSEAFIDGLAQVVKRQLRLNETTQALVDAELARRQIPSNTLGVHIRGSDYKNNFYAHPVFVSVEKYIEEIDAARKAHAFEKIFLATDDDEVLAQMLAHYGEETLIYAEDAARVSGEKGVHNENLESDCAQQRYLLGIEVLCDMYSLAQCSGLMSGLSNVPTFARIYKKSKDEAFVFDKTIDLGINKTGKRCS